MFRRGRQRCVPGLNGRFQPAATEGQKWGVLKAAGLCYGSLMSDVASIYSGLLRGRMATRCRAAASACAEVARTTSECVARRSRPGKETQNVSTATGNGMGRPSDARVQARRNSLLLAASQAIVGSVGPISISMGGLMRGAICSAPTNRWRPHRSRASPRGSRSAR